MKSHVVAGAQPRPDSTVFAGSVAEKSTDSSVRMQKAAKSLDELPQARPATTHRAPLPDIDRRDIGDGRSPKARAWARSRHERTEALTVDAYPALHRAAAEYIAELSPTNPAPVTDYQGQEVTMGSSLVMTAPDGTRTVLVSPELVEEGRRIVNFDISADGKYVTFGTAAQGDDQLWHVVEIATQQKVFAEPIRFNSFGQSVVRFSPDSKGVFYPGGKPNGRKAPGDIYFRSLEGDQEPVRAFSGESVLPHSVVPLSADSALVMANLAIGATPGFPLFTTLVTRQPDGSFSSDTGNMLPAGLIGRVVSAQPDEVIYQTSGHDGRYELVAVDPRKAGSIRRLVPAKKDETLHVAKRVGDKIFTFYLHEDQTWRLRVFDLEGTLLKKVEMEDLGMPAYGDPSLDFSGDARSTSFTDFTFSSVTHPTTTFRIDLDTLDIAARPNQGTINFDASKIDEEHTTFAARDGEQIPIHIYSRNDLPEGERKKAFVYGYGSIGIVNTPGWNRYYQLMLAAGYDVVVVGLRGGGEQGAYWRDAGAEDRRKTINDMVDVGRYLRDERGYEIRVGYGRSWGGWKEENVAAEDSDAFSLNISNVPAGDSARFVNPRDIWSIHDMGADMGLNGEVQNGHTAVQQAADLSSPDRLGAMDESPKVLVFVQEHDDRVEPGSGMRSMHALEERFGKNHPDHHFMMAPGGHSARGDLGYLATFLKYALGELNLRPPRKGD